jgi:hypothetical protein
MRLKTAAHENDVKMTLIVPAAIDFYRKENNYCVSKMTPPVDPAASSQASAEKCLLVRRQGLDFGGELLDRGLEFGFDLPAFFDGRGVAEFGTQFIDVLMGRHLFVSLTFVKDDRRGCEGRRRVKVCASDRRSRRAEEPILSKRKRRQNWRGHTTLRRPFRSRHNGGSEQTGFGLVGTGTKVRHTQGDTARMRRFQIGNNVVEEQSVGFRQSLVVAYRSKLRRSVFARRLGHD